MLRTAFVLLVVFLISYISSVRFITITLEAEIAMEERVKQEKMLIKEYDGIIEDNPILKLLGQEKIKLNGSVQK